MVKSINAKVINNFEDLKEMHQGEFILINGLLEYIFNINPCPENTFKFNTLFKDESYLHDKIYFLNSNEKNMYPSQRQLHALISEDKYSQHLIDEYNKGIEKNTK